MFLDSCPLEDFSNNNLSIVQSLILSNTNLTNFTKANNNNYRYLNSLILYNTPVTLFDYPEVEATLGIIDLRNTSLTNFSNKVMPNLGFLELSGSPVTDF